MLERCQLSSLMAKLPREWYEHTSNLRVADPPLCFYGEDAAEDVVAEDADPQPEGEVLNSSEPPVRVCAPESVPEATYDASEPSLATATVDDVETCAPSDHLNADATPVCDSSLDPVRAGFEAASERAHSHVGLSAEPALTTKQKRREKRKRSREAERLLTASRQQKAQLSRTKRTPK
jgi:hypothetical protein